MSDITELLEAVNEVRTGTTFGRAKASVTALKTLMNMSPDDKRAVAVLVAERAAPQLVERIESGTGQDLSKAQVETVLQMFQKLDADDLADLSATVKDADRRGAALRDVTRSAAGAAALATGLDELLPDPVHDEVDPDGEIHPDDIGGNVAYLDDIADLADDEESRAAVAAAQAAADAELAALEVEAERLKAEARQTILDSERAIAELAAEDRAGADVDDPEASDQVVDQSTVDHEAAADYSRSLFDDLPSTIVVSPAAHAIDTSSIDDTAPSPAVGVAIAATRRELRTARSAGAALAVVTARVNDLGDDADDLLAITGLVPDGWARRRAIEVLIDHDLLHGADGVAAVASLAGAGDRRFVAGSLVAGGFTTTEQLRDVVDAAHLQRLDRRLQLAGQEEDA